MLLRTGAADLLLECDCIIPSTYGYVSAANSCRIRLCWRECFLNWQVSRHQHVLLGAAYNSVLRLANSQNAFITHLIILSVTLHLSSSIALQEQLTAATQPHIQHKEASG
jgi:hypothetical protein